MICLLWLIVPLILASAPGCLLLLSRRWISGAVLLLGALIAITLPLYWDRLDAERLAARGVIVDSPAFLFEPWIYGIPYTVAASLVATVVTALGRRSPRQ